MYLVMPSAQAEQMLNKLPFPELVRIHRCLIRELSSSVNMRTVALEGVNAGCFATLLSCDWLAVYEAMSAGDVRARDELATHGFWLYLLEPLDDGEVA